MRMDQACGLERMDRAYVDCRHLGRVLRKDRLGRMGRVYEHCVRMDLVCGLQEGTDVVAAVGKGRCNHSEHIRHNLLDYCLQVSDTLQISVSNSQGS